MIFLIICAVVLFWLFADKLFDWWFGFWYSKPKEPEPTYDCDTCQDTGQIEIMGDGDNFEWDVIGYKRCPKCNYADYD